MKKPGEYAIAVLLVAAGLSALLPAQSSAQTSDLIEPEAMEALTKMGVYLRSLKAFQVRAEITSEDVLEDGQKIQVARNTNIVARMPDRLLTEVDGDGRSRLYVYDGKSFTLFARNVGYYATLSAPPTIGQVVDFVENHDIELPLVDLFFWGEKRSPENEITAAADVVPSQIGGVSCHHYAFRQRASIGRSGFRWVTTRFPENSSSPPQPMRLALSTRPF